MDRRKSVLAAVLAAALCLLIAAGCALPEETGAQATAAAEPVQTAGPAAETSLAPATAEAAPAPAAATAEPPAATEKPNRFLDAEKTEIRLFTLDMAGRVRGYFLKTGEATMGEALRSLGAIDGTEESWGYFVTTVMGMEAADGGCWTMLDKDGNKIGTGIDELLVADCPEIAFVYDGATLNKVAEPAAEESPTLMVFVQYGPSDEDCSELYFLTHETLLGEALRKEGVISGTQESFGYLVTTVNGMTALDGAYWTIATFDRAAYQLLGKLETGIDETEIDYSVGYAFVLGQG